MSKCFIIPPFVLKNMIDYNIENGIDHSHYSTTLDDTDKIRKNFEESQNTSAAKCAAATMFMMPKRTLMRAIYNANNSLILPGVLARSEGQKEVEDPAVNELYDLTGQVYSFFRDLWARHSIDDRGMIIEASAHYGLMYDNAFWENGRLGAGDGDGIHFERFTRDLTVIAHELVHGITQLEAGIIYSGETGAVNESISDAFGISIDHYVNRSIFQNANWVIGSKILKPEAKLNARGIRDLREPGTAFDDPRMGKDAQPAHYKNYIRASAADEVHLNSGILNKAFYLVCEQLQEPTWSLPIRIWYRALCEYAGKDTHFKSWASMTSQAAVDLYGGGGNEYKAVKRAWNAVGIATEV